MIYFPKPNPSSTGNWDAILLLVPELHYPVVHLSHLWPFRIPETTTIQMQVKNLTELHNAVCY